MNTVKQFGIILALCAAGHGISFMLPVRFPGNMVSMLLLLSLLLLRRIKLESVEGLGDFLLRHMTLFLTPLLVSAILGMGAYGGKIILVILVICAVSTGATMVATALAVNLVIKMKGGRKKEWS